MMNRIVQKMEQLKLKNKKALLAYVTAGFPSLSKTVEIIKAQDEAGIDLIELGIPFSDPIADGPMIQTASYEAICNGANLVKIFDLVEEIRKTCEIALIFKIYYNTILHYGVQEFVEKCSKVGVDGIIIPDLPYEEQFEINEFLDRENTPVLIQFVSSVSKQRIPMILENAKGFVYCSSSLSNQKDIEDYLKLVKSVSELPIIMNFETKNEQVIEDLKNEIDGIVLVSDYKGL